MPPLAPPAFAGCFPPPAGFRRADDIFRFHAVAADFAERWLRFDGPSAISWLAADCFRPDDDSAAEPRSPPTPISASFASCRFPSMIEVAPLMRFFYFRRRRRFSPAELPKIAPADVFEVCRRWLPAFALLDISPAAAMR
jgi:hypothetical protein